MDSKSGGAKAAQHAPELLRPVLAQIGGAERLSRSAAVSDYSSMTAAASALKLRQPVLHGQIARLETELGSPLLTRAERGRAMALTDLRGRVLQARKPCAIRVANDEHLT